MLVLPCSCPACGPTMLSTTPCPACRYLAAAPLEEDRQPCAPFPLRHPSLPHFQLSKLPRLCLPDASVPPCMQWPCSPCSGPIPEPSCTAPWLSRLNEPRQLQQGAQSPSAGGGSKNRSSCLKPPSHFGPSDGGSLTWEAHGRSRSAAPTPQTITFLPRNTRAKPQGCNRGAWLATWLGSQRLDVCGHKGAQTNLPKNFSWLPAYCLGGK